MHIPASPRHLHIGGTIKAPGWEVLNACPGPHVDHVCNANNLSIFPDNTFSLIYSSHVVEHFDYVEELPAALTDWKRILVPGGEVCISVPDIDVLSQMLLMKDKFTLDERFTIMRMMFGGHVDEYDYHLVGLNQDFLASYLYQTGFTNVQRVDKFGFFEDASCMLFKGEPISLNVVAQKPSFG